MADAPITTIDDDTKKPSAWKRMAAIAFPLFFIALACWAWYFRGPLAELFRNRESIRQWTQAHGNWAPLAFIALQVLQVIIFFIPGEVTQIAGGFIFGFWKGALFSLVGIAIGSCVNYFVGFVLGRPFVEAVLKPARLKKAERFLATRKAEAGYFLLFLLPGLPKDALCYLAGMSRAPFWLFFAASSLARLPGIIGSSLIGMAAYSKKVWLVTSIVTMTLIMLICGFLWGNVIEKKIAGIFRRNDKNLDAQVPPEV